MLCGNHETKKDKAVFGEVHGEKISVYKDELHRAIQREPGKIKDDKQAVP